MQRNVTLVYWQRGERPTGANGTMQPAAVNQTVVERTVTFEPGKSLAELELPKHAETTRVTMWLDSAPDRARWTFEHKSAATSMPANIENEGQYFARAGMEFIFPTIVGGFIMALFVRKWLNRAGIGPMYGYGAWIVMITIFTGVVVAGAFSSTAEALVNVPYIASGYVVLIFAAILMETYQKDVGKALFLRPELTDGESFNENEAFAQGIFMGDMEEERVLKAGDGLPSVVRPGLLAFLARAFGARAYLEGAEGMQSRIKLPSSKWDELYLVDPEADSVVDYTPEGWQFDLPSIGSVDDALPVLGGLALAGVLGYAAGQATGVMYLAPVVAALPLVVHYTSPRGGSAMFEAAPAHYRSVFASLFLQVEGYTDARKLDQAKEALLAEKIRRQQDIEDEIEQQDKTLVEELLGEDVDSAQDVLARDADSDNGDVTSVTAEAADDESGSASDVEEVDVVADD